MMHASSAHLPNSREAFLPRCALDLKLDVPVATPAQQNEDIMNLFHEHTELVGLPIVEGEYPIGIINRNIFMNEMARPFVREIYGRKSCIAFMDKRPLTVEGHTPIQELSFQALAAGSKALSDGFIIVDQGRYVGAGTGFDLVSAVTNLQAEKNRLVMESIDYASVIQKSFLRPSRLDLASTLPDHLLHWEPRDVVGGDFFVFRNFADGFFVAVIDCTGHGVPGAFMTLIMASYLDRLLEHGNPRDPAHVMAEMNRMVKGALAQDAEHAHHEEEGSDDGMDTAFLWFDRGTSTLSWAGAKTPLFVLAPDAEEVVQLDGDRMGVGYRTTPADHVWANRAAQLSPGTSVFITTDGIIDQVGGPKRIAFGKKRLRQMLLEHRALPVAEQGECIIKAFRDYQGEQTRRDDVTLFGFRL
ncbi:MAG: SpoIIE family protein phosphatase [Pseudomonadota bacterium]